MLIGLTGYAGSGKDTVAEILVREHGFVRYAFADKLREFVYAQNPTVKDDLGTFWSLKMLVELFGWDYAKRNSQQVRKLLQDTGVWVRENVSEDFWVDLVWQQLDREAGVDAWEDMNIVITDASFPNEFERIQYFGGAVLRVTRPGVGPTNGHSSEHNRGNLPADAELGNVGGLDDLAETVRTAVELFS